MTGRFVIKTHRPGRGVLLGIMVILFVLLAAVFLYQDDRSEMRLRVMDLSAAHDRLEQANGQLLGENEALERRTAVLERTGKVQRVAYDSVDRHLEDLQQQILDLRQEVAFYRGIVSSARQEGLAIQSFQLDRDGARNDYRFRLVLTRNLKSDKVATGTVNLSVAGEQAGSAQRLSLAQLSGQTTEALEFQFRHFQRIQGRLTLPADFVPRHVSVSVQESGSRRSSIERTFDWSGSVS